MKVRQCFISAPLKHNIIVFSLEILLIFLKFTSFFKKMVNADTKFYLPKRNAPFWQNEALFLKSFCANVQLNFYGFVCFSFAKAQVTWGSKLLQNSTLFCQYSLKWTLQNWKWLSCINQWFFFLPDISGIQCVTFTYPSFIFTCIVLSYKWNIWILCTTTAVVCETVLIERTKWSYCPSPSKTKPATFVWRSKIC